MLKEDGIIILKVGACYEAHQYEISSNFMPASRDFVYMIETPCGIQSEDCVGNQNPKYFTKYQKYSNETSRTVQHLKTPEFYMFANGVEVLGEYFTRACPVCFPEYYQKSQQGQY